MGLRSCWDQSGAPSAGAGGTLKAAPADSPRGTTGTGRPWHGGATASPIPARLLLTAPTAQLVPSQTPHPPPGRVPCSVSRAKADVCVSPQMPQFYNSSNPPHPVPPAPGIPMGQQRQQVLERNAPGKKWAARRLLPAPAPCTGTAYLHQHPLPAPTPRAPHVHPAFHPTSHPAASPKAVLSPCSSTRGCAGLGQDQLQAPPAPGGSDPSQIQAGVTGAPCQVRMEEPAHHPMPSLGNPGFPGLRQAWGTRKDGQQEQGCPRKTLLESTKKPHPPKPALPRWPLTSPTPAPVLRQQQLCLPASAYFGGLDSSVFVPLGIFRGEIH